MKQYFCVILLCSSIMSLAMKEQQVPLQGQGARQNSGSIAKLLLAFVESFKSLERHVLEKMGTMSKQLSQLNDQVNRLEKNMALLEQVVATRNEPSTQADIFSQQPLCEMLDSGQTPLDRDRDRQLEEYFASKN